MDRIWAPWRRHYVSIKKGCRKSCIFCIKKGAGKLYDKKRYILKKSDYVFSMLNTFPYNNGHVMIAPYRHVKSLELLGPEEIMDMVGLVNYTKKKLDKKLRPHGFNIGINIEKVAGAGFPGHLHIHIVPRWLGDTNFMPALSDTKVLSHSLDDMWKILCG